MTAHAVHSAAGQASHRARGARGSADDFDHQIKREWLITNGRGGYASGTAIGIPTRRYHGLLVAAARPPLERWMLLSAVLEQVGLAGELLPLASFEFNDLIHPDGFRYQTDFAVHNDRRTPWVRFRYQREAVRLAKQVIMPKGKDDVVIRYRLEGPRDAALSLELWPFLAMRDFHALTRSFQPGFWIGELDDRVAVDAFKDGPRVWLHACRTGSGETLTFERRPDWWYGVRYREESARGQDDHEDLFVPGSFTATGTGSLEVELWATADFTEGPKTPPPHRPAPLVMEPDPRRTVEDRLREAADTFVVTRRSHRGSDLTTILAGYPWFGDWGRDTFIALPGLLLETGRFDEARQVLEVFASAQQGGLVPNRFSDYGEGRDYNSIDASLWYIHAATAYYEVSRDDTRWRAVLAPACQRIVEAFAAGTRFKIHVAPDGLVSCGDESTQLTWMDAKWGDIVFTPRHGKPVEVNALWHHGLCALAEHVPDARQAARYGEMAARAKAAFGRTFWNEADQCLYDVVREGWADPAIRPNQVFAVSLPHRLLDDARERSVLAVVERELLTPFGLRSLAPGHPAYRGQYVGGPFYRDSVYHQGTVWGWLIGPYVEAYLRLHGFSIQTRRRMRDALGPLIEHLDQAGIGSVSEIFDGDPPHTPRGCIAQAWSVAGLLRAWRMTEPSGK